jgi:hypothetical protein
VPFVSDFQSYVISVGQLYPAFDKIQSRAWTVPHRRSPLPGEEKTTPSLETTFFDEGEFNTAELLAFLKSSPGGPFTYHPDQDLRALNIISWSNINDSTLFEGGRVGKKFYLDSFNRNVFPENNGAVVYTASKRFFTSMRPGQESILLNVNLTMSAFYPKIMLDQWINARWPGFTLPPENGEHELKGLRVIFAGDVHNGKTEQRSIFGFTTLTEKSPTFEVKEGNNRRTVSAWKHLKTGMSSLFTRSNTANI